MGLTKRYMESLEEQRGVATQICVDANVLLRCDYHDQVHDNFTGDNTPAYKLGNYRYTKGEYDEVFSDRREMTDAIDWAIKEAALDCPDCDRLRDD